MAETLDGRRLNRAVLARQLLLRRAKVSVPVAAERMAGVQTQYAPSAYVGLWSRVDSLTRGRLTTALRRRHVVQASLMRDTIHIVSRRDYWPIAVGIRNERRRWWAGATGNKDSGPMMEELAERTRMLMADGPRRRADLVAELGVNGQTWNGIGLWLDLVRIPPSGTWERRRADLFWTAERWIPPDGEIAPADGARHLVRRYLAGFGPASTVDIRSFTGLSGSGVEEALESMQLRHLRADVGTDLVDLPRAPLPDADTPAPVRFLPTWDATLLVHARRAEILPERFRPVVFHTRNPHSVPVFTVDGQVAGTWRFDGAAVSVEPFEPLPARARREVDDEGRSLTAFHG